jgi:hypothetical protein
MQVAAARLTESVNSQFVLAARLENYEICLARAEADHFEEPKVLVYGWMQQQVIGQIRAAVLEVRLLTEIKVAD